MRNLEIYSPSKKTNKNAYNNKPRKSHLFRPEASMIVLIQRREQAVALLFLLPFGRKVIACIFFFGREKWKHKETNLFLNEPLPQQTNLLEHVEVSNKVALNTSDMAVNCRALSI